MTINDLAFELVKNKADTNEIKNWEKKIKSWEEEKAYPTLEEIYQMAYIIDLNPGEVLVIRDRQRKQFYKDDDTPLSEKRHWNGLNEDAVWVFQGLARAAIIFVLLIFCIELYKFVDTYYGKTGGVVVDQVITQDIQKHTGQENEIINDGTVENMVKRIKREAAEKNSENVFIENEVDENIIEN